MWHGVNTQFRCGVLKRGSPVCVPPLQISPGKRMGNQIGWNFAISVYKPKQYASRHRYLSPSWFPRGLQFNRHLRELKQPIMGLLPLTQNPTWWIGLLGKMDYANAVFLKLNLFHCYLLFLDHIPSLAKVNIYRGKCLWRPSKNGQKS